MKKISLRQPNKETGSSTTAADEWVRRGAEIPKHRNAEAQKSEVEKLARLTIDLPPALHGQFKAACARKRTKMKAEVLRFIEEWTEKHGNC